VIAFGPVPSRRLGRSLGINHLPTKVCTYSCIYCQVGRTTRLRVRRSKHAEVAEVIEVVRSRVEAVQASGERIEWLSFVPEGEPTLEANLGSMIRGLRPLGIPIAVFTNGSLLEREDVRSDLAQADWVSVKVDVVEEGPWWMINGPHRRLRLRRVLDGMREFAGGYGGVLATETMLLASLNDGEAALRSTASFVAELNPSKAYLAVPTRPPAERWARPASESAVTRAYEVFRGLQGRAELLVESEGDSFAVAGGVREELMAITAVHPMRERAVRRLLERTDSNWDVVAAMIEAGELVVTTYGGQRYVVRPTRRPRELPLAVSMSRRS
jgi:wyosine [tRNA(Phe)-imidazoG37] synthetase (radical SAM superfamily)